MATGTTEFIDTTTADAHIPEIWSKYAIIARESECVWAARVDRRFQAEVMSFGDTIHVPNIGNLSVQTKSLNTAISFETETPTNTDITIGTHQYQAIAIETSAKKQVNRDLLKLYAPKQMYALMLAVDDVLAGLPDNLTNNVGTLGSELTYDDLLRAIQYLDDADVPTGDRTLITSPAQEAGFKKLDYFIHGDYSKLNDGVKAASQRAQFGTFMGIPCLKSTNTEGSNAAGHDSCLFHKEAFALVMQMEPTTHTDFALEFLTYRVVVEQLFGTKEMRDDHAVWLKSA